MKIMALITAIALLFPSVSAAGNSSQFLYLDQCWDHDLAGKLLCAEREFQA